MPKTKYFEGVQAAQLETEGQDWLAYPFDLKALAPAGLASKLTARLFNSAIGPIYGLARRFFPIFKAAGFYHVTLDRDVRMILNQPDVFTVPFGLEMAELVNGAVFALGLNGPEQLRQNHLVRTLIKPEDGPYLTKLAGEFAER